MFDLFLNTGTDGNAFNAAACAYSISRGGVINLLEILFAEPGVVQTPE
jgi:hypothetical protein